MRGARRVVATVMAVGLLAFGLGYEVPYLWSRVASFLARVLFLAVAGLPGLACGVIAARAFRTGRRRRATVFAVAGLGAALLALGIGAPFFRGEYSRDAMAALIFPITACWASAFPGVAFLVVMFWNDDRHPSPPRSWPRAVGAPILWPLWSVLAILFASTILFTLEHGP